MWLTNHKDEVFQSRWPCSAVQTLLVLLLVFPATACTIVGLASLIPVFLMYSLIDLSFMGRNKMRCKIEPGVDTYCVVTGASSGLGSDFCQLLAKRGFNLIISARREERLKALQSELVEKFKVKVEYVVADLGRPGAAEELYEETNKILKAASDADRCTASVAMLINNAGIGDVPPFVIASLPKVDQLLQLNNISIVHATQLFLKDMIDGCLRAHLGGGLRLWRALAAQFGARTRSPPSPLLLVGLRGRRRRVGLRLNYIPYEVNIDGQLLHDDGRPGGGRSVPL